jgi:hypothetical protein
MRNTACWIATTFAFVMASAFAQKPPPPPTPPSSSSPPVEYKPPVRGAPKVRVGGSTRSAARELSLAVVAPDHTGLASSEQPELFWYISQPVKTPLEFTLIAGDAIDPLVEKALPPVASAGIQRIRLSDYGVRLKPGEEYQWSISFVADAASRSKDTVASGRVRVAVVPADLASRVSSAGARSYAEYAGAGYWYDALATLRRQISERPRDAVLLAAQQSLLEQVGLVEIARHERERASGN